MSTKESDVFNENRKEEIEHRLCNLLNDLNAIIALEANNLEHPLIRARQHIESALEINSGESNGYSEQYLANMAGLTLKEYRDENEKHRN